MGSTPGGAKNGRRGKKRHRLGGIEFVISIGNSRSQERRKKTVKKKEKAPDKKANDAWREIPQKKRERVPKTGVPVQLESSRACQNVDDQWGYQEVTIGKKTAKVAVRMKKSLRGIEKRP